jgi:hypothetical protein
LINLGPNFSNIYLKKKAKKAKIKKNQNDEQNIDDSIAVKKISLCGIKQK